MRRALFAFFANCLLAVAAWAWTHGAPTPSITYNIADFGAVCSGTSNDRTAFESFNTAALAYQASNPGALIQLDLPNAGVCGFLGSNGTPSSEWTKGIQKLRLNAYNATITDSIYLAESAQAKAGTNVLTFASVPATIVAGMAPYHVSGGFAVIPRDTVVVSTTATTVTLSANLSANVEIGAVIRFIGSGTFLGGGMPLCVGPASGGTIENGWCDDAFTQTVSAGSTTLTVIGSVPAQFTTGWALMSGLDTQGCFSTPVNNNFFEYVYITAIVGDTITLREPLQFSYESTWPRYCPGSQTNPEAGGPALLRYLFPKWDVEQEYRGMLLNIDVAVNAGGRDITCRDCTFGATTAYSVGGGINPSVNKRMQFINCNGSEINQIEVDKFVWQFDVVGGTYPIIHTQSSSVRTATYTGVTVTNQMNGTPQQAVISNSTIEQLYVGVGNGFGSSLSVAVTGGTINAVAKAQTPTTSRITAKTTISKGVITFPPEVANGVAAAQAVAGKGNLTINGTLASGGVATMPAEQLIYVSSAGNDSGITFTVDGADAYGNPLSETLQGRNQGRVFTNAYYKTVTQVAASGAAAGNVTVGAGFLDAVAWAVPGQWVTLTGRYTNEYAIQIGDLTQDSGGVHISTSLAAGWPTILLPASGDPLVSIVGFPAPAVSFTTVGGTDGANLTRCGSTPAPYLSCYYQILTGSLPTTFTAGTPVQGKFVSVRINVTTAYTGAGAYTCRVDPFVMESNGTQSSWTPTFNCKQAGERIITPAGVTCNGSPGGCSGDSVTSPGTVRFFDSQIQLQGSTDVSATCASTPAQCPVIEFEVRTSPLLNFLLKRDFDPATNDNAPLGLAKVA